jgi:hypothetical protein
MTMVVGYVPTPEGGAAFDRAVSEARRAGEPLVVVNSALHPTDAEGPISTEIVQDALDERLKTAGIEHSIRQLAVGEDPAEVILETAKKVGASAGGPRSASSSSAAPPSGSCSTPTARSSPSSPERGSCPEQHRAGPRAPTGPGLRARESRHTYDRRCGATGAGRRRGTA